ncbi:ABC transporter permease, partial [Nonomuraea aridisoli]
TGAGAARGIGTALLGLAFVLRGVGDVGDRSGNGWGWVSWLSPMAWGRRLHPYAGERWWVLAVALCVCAVIVYAAVALAGRRDLGGGLLPSRQGPAGAAARLRSPLALAWRLHRGSIAARAAGFGAVGFALGATAESLGRIMERGSPQAREVLARLGGQGTLVDQFLVGVMSLLGVAAAVSGVQAALVARAEERAGRAEPVLAAPVGRLRWAAGHLVPALLGPALALALFGCAAGLAHGLAVGDVGGQLPRLLGAALVQLPAVWLFCGLAFALFGLSPRLVAGAYAVLLAGLVLGWAGAELRLAPWVTGLSVFSHLPRLPGGEFALTPLALMTAGAAALVAAGLAGLRRRDVPA